MTEDEIKARGFVPWGGGDASPADWDRGHVLVEDTTRGWVGRYLLGARNQDECWKQSKGFLKVIGYRRKPTEQTAYSPELVDRMVGLIRDLRADHVEHDMHDRVQDFVSRTKALCDELDGPKSDPLVEEAIELVLNDNTTRTENQNDALRKSGLASKQIRAAYNGLRRGIELAKADPS